MGNYKSFLKRLSKVIYAVLVILTFVFAFMSASPYSPHSYEKYSYLVTCDSGKTFDPEERSIEKIGLTDPYKFSSYQLNLECDETVPSTSDSSSSSPGTFNFDFEQYRPSSLTTAEKFLEENYKLTYSTKTIVERTATDYWGAVIIYLAVYSLILEVTRRTYIYLTTGKNFITLK